MKKYSIVYQGMTAIIAPTIEANSVREALVNYCTKLDASILEVKRNTAVIRFWKNLESVKVKILLVRR